MLAVIVHDATPAWIAAVVVGVTVIGQVANTVGGIIGDLIKRKQLQQMDVERTQREVAQHAEVMNAIHDKKETP